MLASAVGHLLNGQPVAVGEPCRSVGKSVQASQAMWSYELNHFQSQIVVVVFQRHQMTSSTGALISA